MEEREGEEGQINEDVEVVAVEGIDEKMKEKAVGGGRACCFDSFRSSTFGF